MDPLTLRALLVEDSEDDALLLLEALRRGGYQTTSRRVDNEPGFRAALGEAAWDVVFLDYSLPQFDALHAIRILREMGSDLPAIIVSGTIGEDIAVEALKLGASDYLLKENLQRLIPAVQRELREAELRRIGRAAEETKRQAEVAVRLSEERHRLLFDFNPMPMWVFAVADQRFLAVNNAAITQYGYRREDFLKLTVPEIQTWEEAATPSPGATRGLAEHRRRDGSVLHVEIVSQPIVFDGHGARIVLAIDVTARRLAEQQLKESEWRLRRAQRIARLGHWEREFTEARLFWSDEVVEMFGTRREDLTGRVEDFYRAVHPDDRQRVAQLNAEAHRTGGFTDFEHRIVRPDGEIRHLHIRAEVTLDSHGRALRQAGTVQDITERKRTERKIEEQAALLDQAQDAILIQDLAGTVSYWNRSAERVFGWTGLEVVGQRLQDFLCESREEHDAAVASVLRQGDWAGEVSKFCKDGSRVLVEARWTLLRDQFGDARSILAINTDITEKKKLEAQFFRAQRMESIGTLAGGIAHDLNNVLGPIIMAIDLFKFKITDPRDLDLLDIMETSAQRGADMVKQVLSFARGIDGKRLLLQPQRLLRDIQKIAGETFPKTISLTTRLADGIWHVIGDPTQLHQVLVNLCVNARDAMSAQGGTIAITARNLCVDAQFATMSPDARPGVYVVFEVADTGSGMSPETAGKIFEPFFTTKEVGKGTGLGLSTTLAIVKSHGGFITVESQLGRGTTFQVHIPADEESVAQPATAETAELPRGHGELILVIDDEAPVRRITAQTLEAFGYKVITASDGAEGVAQYAQHAGEIGAVITDMMMPVMDGVATIRALMRIDPKVRIIAASGLSTKGAEAESAGDGVKFFVPKPFTADTILKALRALLDPGKS